MCDVYEQTSEFRMIEAIAETIRAELGDEVEACPGFQTPEEAEPLNRVFRAMARRILQPLVAPGQDLSSRHLGLAPARLETAGGRWAQRAPDQILLELESGAPMTGSRS